MEIIAGGRRSGKTTRLIQLSAEYGSYIICPSYKHVDLIVRLAKDMELDIPPPMTFEEFRTRQHFGRAIRSFLIDDADKLLAYLSDMPIQAITITVEEEDDDNVKANLSKV